jgi:PAS domain S-box-containing protein
MMTQLSTKHIEILLIEDNEFDSLLIQEMLLDGGLFNVETIGCLSAALNRLGEKDFNVLLTDLSLPDSDRTETFEKIYVRFPEIPIILLTSYDDEAFALRAIQSGAQDYLIKGKADKEMIATSIRYAIERKRCQAETRRHRNEWERTFDAIENVMTILDNDMRIIRANRAAGQILHTDPSELIGKHCYEVFQRRTEHCRRCRHEKNRCASAEIEMDYLGKTFQITLSPILKNDTVKGFVHTAKDISENKKLEAHLLQFQKTSAIAALAGGIAHDLNNILFPISGYTEMTMEMLPNNIALQKNMEQVLKAANRAQNIVQQILTFSRQSHEAGKQERKPYRIQPVIREVLNLLRVSFPSTIEIRSAINDKCDCIMADPVQIQQVIMSLCTNAYHAMREKGGILTLGLDEIRLEPYDARAYPDMDPGAYLKLTVSDTGHGMDKSVMEKIFDPYFTTKAQNQGSGLGLSVAIGIIKSHNGYITVYSELNQGTTFNIYIPLIETEAAEPAPASFKPSGNGRERILLVDDDESVTDMFKEILEKFGYRVTPRTSSIRALKEFREKCENFDLVITDTMMPDITGIELSKELVKIRPDIPIILCTGFSELFTEEDLKTIGIRECLIKPVTIKKISQVVRRVLDSP